MAESTRVLFAEVNHQQYLHKNPGGYCGLSGCNISANWNPEKA